MSDNRTQSYTDSPMLDLFMTELDGNAKILAAGLATLTSRQSAADVEPLARAAHSIRGAARIVGLPPVVSLAHAMESLLSAIQTGGIHADDDDAEVLIAAGDIFLRLLEADAA